MMSLVKATVWRFLNFLPDLPAVDRIEALLSFWVAHRRLPRRGSGLFNDRLFFFKTDPKWTEDPLRVFVSDKELAKIFIRGVLGKEFSERLSEESKEHLRENAATLRAGLDSGFPPLRDEEVRGVHAPVLLMTGKHSPAFLLPR